MATQEQILEALKQVKYPGYSRDIVSFGLVKGVEFVAPKGTVISVELSTADANIPRILQEQIVETVCRIPGFSEEQRPVDVRIKVNAPAQPAAQAGSLPQTGLPGVKHIVAVASGKGGVGKSTVAANLTAAFKSLGFKVGLCDCDLYGPSMGLMFGTAERPTMGDDELINPVEVQGIKLMSMGLLVEDESPVILRGPMVTRYTQQFLRSVNWGELDVLVLDLPPGTGDIQLTIVQTLSLSGAVIVSTPQEVALIDARKAVKMFHKVNVPILGIVENMSYFLCPDNNKRYDIFGSGGGRREAEKLGVPLLGEIPLEMAAREAGDQGKPVVWRDSSTLTAKTFVAVAEKLKNILFG
ncbi:MAG: Mrp/NBP35 family ATP-binding protein [Verrucomicrobiales bacterium]|jgi:ATP-binding protein involved in chromosome partitioning|nr:Mrp/NBP35 family ATP-binding protein [Verrucomicrobiales bacterium]